VAKPSQRRDIDTVRALYGLDIYYNFDIPGGDYSIFPMETDPDCTSPQQEGDTWVCKSDPACVVPTQRRCQLACAADVRCKAYTYVGIGLLNLNDFPENAVYPYCFLKDNVSDRSSWVSTQVNINSGVRRDSHKCSFV